MVVVVVLLVPELFHGRPATDSGTGRNPAAGPPVRSYTIDLRDSGGGQQPAVASPVVPTAPAASNAAAPAPAAPTPVPKASAPAATPVAKAPAPSAVPLAAAAPPGKHAASAQPALTGWVVQVGSFSQRDHAERMVKDLAAKGFTVEVAGPDDHGLFRVRSPPHAERAAANALRQKMQASGLKPIVSRVP